MMSGRETGAALTSGRTRLRRLLGVFGLMFAILAGCQQPRGEDKRRGPYTVASSMPCEALSRSRCPHSEGCVLDWVGNLRYVCRPKQGICEEGLYQFDEASCRARESCTWDPGSCYCPLPGYGETVAGDDTWGVPKARGPCACAGGPAPMCRPKGQRPSVSPQ